MRNRSLQPHSEALVIEAEYCSCSYYGVTGADEEDAIGHIYRLIHEVFITDPNIFDWTSELLPNK